MQQQISVVTLGIGDLARSRRFYADGFGWKPVLETQEIIFYQMKGLIHLAGVRARRRLAAQACDRPGRLRTRA